MRDLQGILTGYRESDTDVQVVLRRSTTRYLDHFLRLRCAPDLIARGLFPNAKEITESMAAAYALLRNGGLDRRAEDAAVVCVGDGTTPRTAALLAYRTRWTCWAVDPLVTGDWPIRRLHVAASPIQRFTAAWPGPVAVMAVHAHVPLEAALDRLAELGMDVRAAVAMPCCGYRHEAPGMTLRWEGDDWGVWSPHRTVRAWIA